MKRIQPPHPGDDDADAIFKALRDELKLRRGGDVEALAVLARVSGGAAYTARAGKVEPNLRVTARLLRALGYRLELVKV